MESLQEIVESPQEIVESPQKIVLARRSLFLSNLAHEFAIMYYEQQFVDFWIQSGDESFPCHRMVLAGNSLVLKNMLSTQMLEADQQEMELHNISPHILDILLPFMYSGHAEMHPDDLIDVIEAADFLDMTELFDMCIKEAFLVITICNVMEWFHLANKINHAELQAHCAYVMSMDSKLLTSYDFLDMELTQMEGYLMDVSGKEVDPDVVLESVLLWVDEVRDERLEFLEDLLQHVTLEHCSAQCIKEVLDRYKEMLQQIPNAYQMILMAYVEGVEIGIPVRRKRKTKSCKESIVLVGGNDDADEIIPQCLSFDPDGSPTITEGFHIPFEHSHLRSSICAVPLGFAVTGGEHVKTCALYDAVKGTWHQLTDMYSTRSAHASLHIQGLLFVFGGHVDQTGASGSVEFIALGAGDWDTGPSVPFAVEYPEVASIKDDIYLLDITNNYLMQNCVGEGFMRWRLKTPMPGLQSYGARMLSLNGQLFVAGGVSNILTWYTPAYDEWCIGASMQMEHSYGALIARDQTLYVLGGTAQEHVQKYDIKDDTWTICDYKLPKAMWSHHAIVLEGKSS